MSSTRAPLRHLPDPLPFALLEAREAAGWSLHEAARQTGVSRRMLQHLERGDRVPSRAVADVLVNAYRLEALNPAAAVQLRRLSVPDRGRCSPYRRDMAPLREDVAMGTPSRRLVPPALLEALAVFAPPGPAAP